MGFRFYLPLHELEKAAHALRYCVDARSIGCKLGCQITIDHCASHLGKQMGATWRPGVPSRNGLFRTLRPNSPYRVSVSRSSSPRCSDAISGHDTLPLREWHAHTSSVGTASIDPRSMSFSSMSRSLCSPQRNVSHPAASADPRFRGLCFFIDSARFAIARTKTNATVPAS